ncbi:soluble guanylate cyclase 88E-like isoform X2 [Acanthaster planci]|uniref:guanylate cyclase n=1 Tax=Acanthaster planci TaxID=133434 RepID=A0A8B7XQ32_ACAPL|nr:soluble guanylate cyclase 88E-like isoform X2 [Acanthaster planci]
MYGLLVENTIEVIKETYGEEAWLIIREKSRIHEYTYVTHRMYSERIIPRLAQAVSEYTGCTTEEFMDLVGRDFVRFLSKYGYDKMLRVLGRSMRDFLNGLDNLHEYLRFSYPKMKPPSFFCTDESSQGLTLHYRSRRPGYVHYVKGQLKSVGRLFYNLDVSVELVSEETRGDTTYVVFKLFFDNKEFVERDKNAYALEESEVMKASLFFDLFPFHIMFNRKMIIKNVGKSLLAVLPNLVGKVLTDVFELKRPLLNFTWENIRAHENVVFEVITVNMVVRSMSSVLPEENENEVAPVLAEVPENVDDEEYKDSKCTSAVVGGGFQYSGYSICDDECNEIIAENLHPRRLRLKGQMKYVPDWDGYVFLATPFMPNLDAMFQTGLYINDLSMYDSSRDLVLAGTQQSAELKIALDQELQKSAQLEQSMRKLDQEMKRTDSLLYQMIPKAVADKLRRGEPATSTCEVFKDVTILFSDVVGFTQICSRIEPMQVVSMLNAMYTKFDQLSEAHEVYKVETIGDAYMIVAGAPIVTKFHAVRVAEMALAMKREIGSLKDPSTGHSLQIRIGIHSGMVVAGVVGLKMPRYCLFGDTVNTASRMESTGEAMRIHLSESTRAYLNRWTFYILLERPMKTEVKGKGQMKTYFLMGKEAVDELDLPFNLSEEDALNASRSSLNSSTESLRSAISRSFEAAGHRSLMSPNYTPVNLEGNDRPRSALTGMVEKDTLDAPKPHGPPRRAEGGGAASPKSQEGRVKEGTALNVNNSRGSSDVTHDVPLLRIKDGMRAPLIEGKVNNKLFDGSKNQANLDPQGKVPTNNNVANETGGQNDCKSNVRKGVVSPNSSTTNAHVQHSTTCVLI